MVNPSEVQVTLLGNAVTEPEFAICANGTPRAAFRLVVSERKFDQVAGVWTNSRQSFYSVVCWSALADHVGSSVTKGDPLIVTGKQNVVDWARDGKRGTVVQINASALGHDLRFGLGHFQRIRRRQGTGEPVTSTAQTQSAPTPGAPDWPPEPRSPVEQPRPAAPPPVSRVPTPSV
jgi:single-strand DNA-binding protein